MKNGIRGDKFETWERWVRAKGQEEHVSMYIYRKREGEDYQGLLSVACMSVCVSVCVWAGGWGCHMVKSTMMKETIGFHLAHMTWLSMSFSSFPLKSSIN